MRRGEGVTPKNRAIYRAQRECGHYSETAAAHHCDLLTECFCCLESKPCHFYDNPDVPQRPGLPKLKPRTGPRKALTIPTREETAEMVRLHDEERRSWNKVAAMYGTSTGAIEKARRAYGFPMAGSQGGWPAIPRAIVLEAKAAREAGVTWDEIVKRYGITRKTLLGAIRRL